MPPKQEVFHIHPYGWENDPEEERFKVTTLDYLAPCTYNNYAIFFRLEDADKAKTIDILKAGLERTIAQARHYCCVIEKDPDYGHSFVKKNDSTVRLFVQYLDDPRDGYPTIQDFEKSNFSAVTMGDLKLWSVNPMTYGEKPEAHPDNRPVASAFRANFIRGGMVLHIHHHHYSNDVMGCQNCHAFANKTTYPPWDPKNLDLSWFCKPDPPMKSQVDGPPPQSRHPDHTTGQSILFHLPKSKAAELKKLAKPEDGTWISTYGAFSAFIWRTLTRVRAPVFNPDLSPKLFWAEAIDMRRRMKVLARIQHNVMFAALSPTAPVEQPTAGEVISEWPLWKVARYIRQMTNTVTEENLSNTLDMVATVRDKTSLNIQIDAKPPLSILMTDHRDAKITETDWGFAKPITYRHVIDNVGIGVIVVYPPRDLSPESDEGPEFAVFYEKRLAQTLINDPEWNKYLEYRGVDAEDTSAVIPEEVKSVAITA
ncbi:Trichothecene 3-O-acetyltransferase [Cytospora mali]|uniref:Trichothecene 3-O-acetyltransferase n=1 Tax=Cytospora mali TaxID=578113 RepID=A0A194UZT7_CYTMA|nr:Trichothecene 3-O-acetyltransferase [Valsa mali var. pyri (nom. inval.)]